MFGVKAGYELPTAAYEEILHISHVTLGNAGFPKTEAASLKALGISPDISSIRETLVSQLRATCLPAAPYREDLSKNAFLNSDFGMAFMEATDGAIGDSVNLIMDVGIDGIQLTKLKHHSATVYVTRVANVPR
eukprot:jgi/Tetstr1/435224/TSEL_024143.t1